MEERNVLSSTCTVVMLCFCNPDDDVSQLEEYEDCVQIVSALVSD